MRKALLIAALYETVDAKKKKYTDYPTAVEYFRKRMHGYRRRCDAEVAAMVTSWPKAVQAAFLI
jgi:hypothetical protein